ncbi:MAG: hypothetical protein ACI9JM_000112 [Halioglobus sp.]|jgi:hypothetical protein
MVKLGKLDGGWFEKLRWTRLTKQNQLREAPDVQPGEGRFEVIHPREVGGYL